MEKPYQTTTSVMIHLFFLAITLSFSPLLPDMDYTPRLLTASIFLIPFLILVFLILKKDKFVTSKSLFVNSIVVAAFIFLFVLFKSYFFSINQGDSLFELLKYSVAFVYLLIFVFLFYKTEKPIQLVARSILLPLLIIAFMGLWQLTAMQSEAIRNNAPLEIGYQLSSLLSNKNSFAEYLLLCLPLLIYTVVSDKGLWRVASFANLLLALFFIYLLKSFSVFVAFMVVMMVCVAVVFFAYKETIRIKSGLSMRKFYATVVTSFVALIIVSFFVINKLDGFNKLSITAKYISGNTNDAVNNDNSVFERLLLWRNSVKMIKEKTLNGVGLGNWKIFFPSYGYTGAQYLSTDSVKFTRAHNDFLQLFAETGLLGFLSFLFLFFISIYISVKSYLKTKESLWMFLLSGICSYFAISLFGFPSEKFLILIMLVVYVSLIVVSRIKNRKHQHFTFNKSIIVVFMAPLILSLFSTKVCAGRLQSEILFKRITKFQEQHNWTRMYQLTQKINTQYFPIDYTATPVAWYQAAASYLNNKKDEALNYYYFAKEQTPYHVQVYNDIGAVYLNAGENENAAKYFKLALEINPKFPDALFNQGIAIFNTGNKWGAYKIFKDVYAIHPPNKYNDYMIIVVNAIADSVFKARNVNLAVPVLDTDLRNTSNVWAVEVNAMTNKTDFITELDNEMNSYNFKKIKNK